MDISNTFIIQLVIQWLTNVNCDEIRVVSSLLDSEGGLRCENPFLSLYTIGYIQCQRACVHYALSCDIMRYSKYKLECHLHLNTTCTEYHGEADPSIFIRRKNVGVSIGGDCRDTNCPDESACVKLNFGTKCFSNKVLRDNRDYGASFVDADGILFGLYPVLKTHTDAQQFCEESSGRLAVLDTPIKFERIIDAVQWYGSYGDEISWFVGVSRMSNGSWWWSNGKSAHVPVVNQNANCASIYRNKLDDQICSVLTFVVCEMP